MIEIEKADARSTIKEKIKIKKKKGKIELKQSSFFDKFLEIQEVEGVKKELNELINEIDEKGREFVENPNLDTLRAYKSLVKGFLEIVINKLYKVKERMKKTYFKKKVYVIVETIDKKLEELTKYILNRESDRIKLLSLMDEIRGLLIDLYK